MTNNIRVFLWIALALALWMNYEAWNRDYGAGPASPTQARSSSQGTGTQSGLETAIPQASQAPAPQTAQGSLPPATGSTAPATTVPTNGEPSGESGGTVRVRTDVLDLRISLQGGTLVEADLLRYPRVKGEKEPVRLLNRDSPVTLYALQTGLTGPKGAERPTHLTELTSAQPEYTLAPNQNDLRVPLTWTDGNGVTVTKTYIFQRGWYRIGIEYQIENRSGEPWSAAQYAQILRNDPPTDRSMFDVESYSFHGPAMWDGTKYRKLDIEDQDDQRLSIPVQKGWIAALQHHFVSAVVTPEDASYTYTLRAENDQRYLLAAAGPLLTVPAGQTATLKLNTFVGPKLQAQLEETGPELDRVADYGHLTLLARPLFVLLEWVHGILNNWGGAIIFVTFLLKLLFYPLSEASGKSMAKMKALAPRI